MIKKSITFLSLLVGVLGFSGVALAYQTIDLEYCGSGQVTDQDVDDCLSYQAKTITSLQNQVTESGATVTRTTTQSFGTGFYPGTGLFRGKLPGQEPDN